MVSNSNDKSTMMTAIGSLPDHWEVSRLGQYAELITKGSSPRWQGFKYVNQGITFIRAQNVGEGRLELADLAYLDQGFNEKERKSILRNKDLLITIAGTIGRVAVANRSVEGGNINQAVALVRLQSGLLPEFAAAFLLTHAGQAELAHNVKRLAQANLSLQNIRDLRIPVPPISEQRAIANVLRTVQRSREATEKVIAATRQLKQSLMQHLFTYGPIPVDQAELVEMKDTDFGCVPKRWPIMPLSDCAEVQTGIAKGRKIEAAEAIMVPYLRVANVQDGSLDLNEIKQIPIRKEELQRFALRIGDVLLTEGGDFDKLGRGFIWNGQVSPCVHQNHIFAVRANGQILSSDYLAYLMQSQYGKSYFLTVAHRTTHLACINTTKLKAFPVPVPPLQDQAEITRYLKEIDRKYEFEIRRKSAVERLFQTLLYVLMTGQIRLPEFARERAR
jgi:type I restriction enzyme, S subunit